MRFPLRTQHCLGRKASISAVTFVLLLLFIHQMSPVLIWVSPSLRHVIASGQSGVTRSVSDSNATSNATGVNNVAFYVNVSEDFIIKDNRTQTTPAKPEAIIGVKPLDRSLLELDPIEHIEGSSAHIPQIIHQFWDAPGVPAFFKNKVKSWADKHPAWEYWFWQAPDVRLFLNTCFPEYLSLYKRYPETVNRADAMRYFVLFTFGGLYVDLDMEALKANDDLLKKAPCVLTEETYEHSVLLYNRVKQPNLINAYMATRPRHPLFKMAIEGLPKSRGERDALRRAGPFFLDHIFQVYNQSQHNSHTGKWTRPVDDIIVLNPRLVMPSYDRGQEANFRRKCMVSSKRPAFYRQVCQEFARRRRSNKPYPESYANHLWTHTYLHERKWKSNPGIPIKDIVPRAVNVTERILKVCTVK